MSRAAACGTSYGATGAGSGASPCCRNRARPPATADGGTGPERTRGLPPERQARPGPPTGPRAQRGARRRAGRRGQAEPGGQARRRRQAGPAGTRAPGTSGARRSSGSGFGNSVGADDSGVAAAAALDRAALGRVVDVDQAETLVVAVRPLEVIQQRPGVLPGEGRALAGHPGRPPRRRRPGGPGGSRHARGRRQCPPAAERPGRRSRSRAPTLRSPSSWHADRLPEPW